MKPRKEQKYVDFIDVIESNLLEVEFEGDYYINTDTAGDKFGDRLIVDITIKGDKDSYVCFTYLPSKKLIEHVRATLRGNLKDRGHDFLYSLENLALKLGCTEMRTLSNEEFWKDTDWIRYSDGTYRKCLRPDLN